MKVIFGLGNPGIQYIKTRHNVGFDVIDLLDQKVVSGLLLNKPQTFMNLSGRAVKKITVNYKIEPKDVLVICDDVYLNVGTIRLKFGGSSGGQKGIQNIIDELGTNQFARLKIGVGPKRDNEDLSDFVLGRFEEGEVEAIRESIERAAGAAMLWFKSGLDVAMNKYNENSDHKRE